jgi:hypothetical protein
MLRGDYGGFVADVPNVNADTCLEYISECCTSFRGNGSATMRPHSPSAGCNMSLSVLLNAANKNTVGADTVLRIIGSREPPTNMVVQIAITGSGVVQIQGRIARDAPWQDIGPQHTASALFHIQAVQFLRAIASEVGDNSKVSVWADWAW